MLTIVVFGKASPSSNNQYFFKERKEPMSGQENNLNNKQRNWLLALGNKLLFKSSGLQRLLEQKIDKIIEERFEPFLERRFTTLVQNDSSIEQKIDKIIEQKTSSLFEQKFATLAQNDPSLVGKFFSAQKDLNCYVQEKQTRESSSDNDLPVPPQDLWEGYGDSAAVYLEWGRQHIVIMTRILAKDGFEFAENQRIMELGCAAGRMLRWLVKESEHSELWGTDLSAKHILWCQQNLSPPFNFATTTATPSLPFPDNYFDFIYAGSVFTHIGELTDAWLLELRRILKQDGRLYITVHDRNTIQILQNKMPDLPLAKLLSDFDTKVKFKSANFEVFYINSSPRGGQIVQVFYDMDYLKSKLSRLYDLKSVNEEAYGYQTAVLLQKR
jgi:ubiquinone/menaquinone biosynthesis C-methylase UbiE